MKPFSDDLLAAASLADDLASELVAAADKLGSRGNTAVARALLQEARRHNSEAIRLRTQSGARRRQRLQETFEKQPHP